MLKTRRYCKCQCLMQKYSLKDSQKATLNSNLQIETRLLDLDHSLSTLETSTYTQMHTTLGACIHDMLVTYLFCICTEYVHIVHIIQLAKVQTPQNGA